MPETEQDNGLSIEDLLEHLRQYRKAEPELQKTADAMFSDLKKNEIVNLVTMLVETDRLRSYSFTNDSTYQLFRIMKLDNEAMFGTMVDCMDKSKQFKPRFTTLKGVALEVQIDNLESEGFTRATHHDS